jgi:hypothetical protein
MKIWIAVLLILTALAYAGFFLSLSNPPFTDAPNHFARAVIMNSLWFDAHSPFQGMFSASRSFTPYMLPDLGLIILLRQLGAERAYPVWSMLSMLSLALGVSVYASQLLETSWAKVAAVLCSFYFATNYLFLLGFFSFQWGLAAAFVALGALEAWRRGKSRWWIAVYALACFVCYGAHIACLAILAGMVGATGLVRIYRKEQTPLRLILELLPFAILAGYRFPVVPTHPETAANTLVRKVGDKFGHFLEAMFVRQSYLVDRRILLLLGAVVAGGIWFGVRRRVDLSRHWQPALVSGLGMALYFALPPGLGPVAYVDQRALPFLFIPLTVFTVGIVESASPNRRQIALLLVACFLLAAANLGSLALFLPRQSRLVSEYRRAIAAIPEGQIVLAVDAQAEDGNSWPMRHVGSFYAADRKGYTPYLFSQQNGSGPSAYFHDLSTIYRPGQDWYLNQDSPDWEKLVGTYDYVIVSRPWSPDRMERSHLEVYFENAAATVFRVRRGPLANGERQ